MTTDLARDQLSMYDHALAYLADELSVFPACTPIVGRGGRCLQHGDCKSPGKTPLIKWGIYQDEVATADEAKAWWLKRWPTANIAMATGETSNAVVLDLDGEVAQANAVKNGYEDGPWTRTGRPGGQHRWFRYRPDAPTIFAKQGGIDFRGQGGYVLLPPSLHASGNRYEWGKPLQRGEPLPELPRWVDQLALANNEGTAKAAVDFGKLIGEGISEGQRDQELFRAASKLRGAGVPIELAIYVVERAAESCTPPFPLDEARKKVESAYSRYRPNEQANGHVTPRGWTARALVQITFEPARWAIRELLPAGLCILAGRPKLGKSWLGLAWSLAVAAGARAMGRLEVVQGEALYLALEDGPRRVQERLAMLLGETEAPEGLHIFTEWPRMDEGGLDALETWLAEHPSTRLITIDTFKRVRPLDKKGSEKRLYDSDYDALAPLQELATRHNVAIVVVFHTRKGESADPLELISGTLGLSGAADCAMVLRRERGQADASLFVTGRDLEEQDLALRWDGRGDPFGWQLLGDAAQFRLSKERSAVVDALVSVPGMTPTEIAGATGMAAGNIRRLLFNMVRDAEVRSRDGRYYRVTDGTDVRPVTDVTAAASDQSLMSGGSGSYIGNTANTPPFELKTALPRVTAPTVAVTLPGTVPPIPTVPLIPTVPTNTPVTDVTAPVCDGCGQPGGVVIGRYRLHNDCSVRIDE